MMFLHSMPVHAQNVRIAAAADLKFALDAVLAAFEQRSTEVQLSGQGASIATTANAWPTKSDSIDVVYGSSGKFHTQILQGAPYDIYFSADIAYAESLKKQGLTAGEVMPYAQGRIVLWRLKAPSAQALSLNSLIDPKIKHIAIANPAHAPYGRRAKEALHHMRLWPSLNAQLVYGENVAQAAQFVQTGHAQLGVIALSLALSPPLQEVGEFVRIPQHMHTPLVQGVVLTKRAAHNANAKALIEFMRSEHALAIMANYGFTRPHTKMPA